MTRLALAGWIGLVLWSGPAISSAQVRVWAATMDLPVYAEGKPDPNPPFDQFGGQTNYPYALRQNISDQRVNEHLRAVYLENEYLKCSVLPDLGGHLYTCIDKLSGQSMFYANPSIKKARIGYRGAWAAFGDEFNFPISHNWVSLSPVDFSFAAHPDGSASVTVGNIDRVYGMEWTVEMVLRPGSTVLEEKITLSNRSDVRHRFFWWNNAGVEVWEDSKICYPTEFTAAHGFADIDRWPVTTKGMDFSVIRNQQDGPVSRFVYGSREPYVGVWNPHTNSGIVHYAEYGVLPGKKFWSWGDDAPGREWRHILSDNNSTYVEVQAGPFRNQETFAFLQPRQSMRFSEYWIPVRGLGGVARANLIGALNLRREASALIATLNVNQKLPGATVRLLDGSSVLFEEHTDLAPEKTWMKKIGMKQLSISAAAHPYRMEVSDAAGKVILAQTEGKYDVTPAAEVEVGPQKRFTFPAADARSADDWLQMGEQQELNGSVLGALGTYRSGLVRAPASLSLMRAEGRLLTALLRYDEAATVLEAAYARDLTDLETAYYLGLSFAGQGKERRARELFEAASRMHGMDAAAHLQLAEMDARDGDLNAAEHHLQAALLLAPDDARLVEEQAAVLHALGDEKLAKEYAAEASSRFPTSSFLREEMGAPDLTHLAADPYRVLGVATEYMRLGMFPQALAVLSREYPAVPAEQVEPGAVLPQQHATVLYYKAYCAERMGQAAAADYAAAARASTLNVFPRNVFGAEVFGAAIKANEADANAHYLLGMDEFSRGLTDSSMHDWTRAAALDPRISSLYASLGKIDLTLRKDTAAALLQFEQGQRNDGSNPDVYTGLNQSLSLLGRPAAERSAALDSYPDRASLPQTLVYELALAKAENRDHEGAQAVFRDRFFSSGEGDIDVRQVWVEVALEHAQDLAAAGKCNPARDELRKLSAPVAGFPFTRQILPAMVAGARMAYVNGTAQKVCHDENAAKASFASAEQATRPDEVYWSAQAAKQLGHYETAAWHDRLVHAKVAAMERIGSSNPSYWTYVTAMLEGELGDLEARRTHLEDGLRLPDRMLAYHLIRMARDESRSSH